MYKRISPFAQVSSLVAALFWVELVVIPLWVRCVQSSVIPHRVQSFGRPSSSASSCAAVQHVRMHARTYARTYVRMYLRTSTST